MASGDGWVLDSDGLLTISSDEGCVRKAWGIYREQISKLKIEDGVSTIGEFTFGACRGITEIIISDSVTSIASTAFYDCSSITEIKVEEGNKTYDSRENSNSIIDTENNELIIGCSNTTIPDSVTSIGGGAFSGCSSITEITIPDSVTSIGGSAFSGCSNITKITIPDSVTSIGGGAFSGCSSITEITIPDSVTSIGERAFEGCSSITKITISDSVTSIGEYAFCGCSSITEITIPDSVTSIGDFAFSGCSSITEITIPDSVTSIAVNVFADCSSIMEIRVEEGNKAYDSRENSNAIINTENNELIAGCSNTTIPDSVTSIGDLAFSGCSNMTKITIPDSVTSIGVNVFGGCSSITEIKVEEGNKAYDSRENSNAIINTENNELIAGCSNTTIPDSVTSIGDFAFNYCSSITKITIPASVTNIGFSAFNYCSNITEIIIPASVTSIGPYAFYGCSSLEKIIIKSNVPATFFGEVFEGVKFIEYNKKGIIVPKGSAEAYKNADGWSEYKDYIMEAEESDEPAVPDTPNKPDTPNTPTESVSTDVKKDDTAPDTKISTPTDDLTDMVLTENEKQLAAAGTVVTITLDVADVSLSIKKEEKELVEKSLNGYKAGSWLDIKLSKIIGGISSSVTKTNGKISIEIAIPDSLKSSGRVFGVIRVHDGVAEFLNDLDNSSDTITISTDSFSTYALVYKDVENNTTEASNETVPETGDFKPVIPYVMIIAITACACIYLYLSKGMEIKDKK